MNELIKITEKDGKQAVSARELYAFLEVKSKFNDWFKSQSERAMLDEKMDFIAVAEKKVTAQGNESEYIDYALSLNSAKEIAMLNGGDKGKQARTYFIECERKLKETALPQSFAQALRLAAEQQEKIEAQEAQMRALAPKVDYYESVLQSESLITSTVIAKDLGMSATKLNMILKTLGIAYKEKSESAWVLYSKYQDKGYTKTKTHTYESDGVKLTRHHTYWTEAGREFVMKKVREFLNVKEVAE